MSGLSLGNADTLLTQRAADYLAAGPADPQTLISHVCQIPGTPPHVAEHMAAALFAGHQKFMRTMDGRWSLRGVVPSVSGVIPSLSGVIPSVSGVIPSVSEGSTIAVEGYATRTGRKIPRFARNDGGFARNDGGSSRHDRPLADESFVVVDVETTGSRAVAGDRITEVAVVHVQHGVARTVFDTLVNPERPIPPSITAITNITAEMVRHAPRFRDIVSQLLGALEGHVFVAHNANFDWRFISYEIERVTRRPLVGRKLCTVKLARRMLPQLRRRNLDALQHFYGVTNHARHRAGGDAEATAQIFLRLLDAARDRGHETLDDLDRELSRGASRKKRRRRPPALPHSASDDSSA